MIQPKKNVLVVPQLAHYLMDNSALHALAPLITIRYLKVAFLAHLPKFTTKKRKRVHVHITITGTNLSVSLVFSRSILI